MISESISGSTTLFLRTRIQEYTKMVYIFLQKVEIHPVMLYNKSVRENE